MKKCINNKNISQEKETEYRRYCKCGHSIPIVALTRKQEYIICSWCGGRIYKDLQKQKEYDYDCARKEFKFKMREVL